MRLTELPVFGCSPPFYGSNGCDNLCYFAYLYNDNPCSDVVFGITTPGYVTTLCAVLFLGGITEMSIGILGEYIGRIYMETKDRPIYITKFSNFEDEDNEEKE